ncbi:hypothetical protein [Methylorubrum extorquens]|uniref:hypothetical protein n=1 Tax=Methylorubrum extorquens TaxID=408 RepID=UPI0020A193BF|nr:hypothetical protein [Methylorubrum extorquens]MCP1540023.1 hypothetical protein [Methylorubrum extorquens]
MPDTQSHARVKRLREARKASGQREMNVWVPAHVQKAIEKAVEEGRFPSRRLAIVDALERQFVEK